VLLSLLKVYSRSDHDGRDCKLFKSTRKQLFGIFRLRVWEIDRLRVWEIERLHLFLCDQHRPFFMNQGTSYSHLSRSFLMSQSTNGGADFSVVIAASAPVSDGALVHAVTVIQPVQTWTVIRGQDDFIVMAVNLESSLTDLPPCPTIGRVEWDANSLLASRNELQQWLTAVLMHPGARESQAVRNFLTYAANMIPPQYENVPWTMFAANGQVSSETQDQGYSAETQSGAGDSAHGNLDDMVMDDMFDAGDDVGPVHTEDYDDVEEYRPSERYKLLDEPITEEDEMDIAMMAAEVEMIEDVGTLAQSLGASHLGRSLMLQEEMSVSNKQQAQAQVMQHPQPGVQLGSAVAGSSSGGIGNAMQNARPGTGGGFHQSKVDSQPRLDAFKMIKVIGKGSFGEYTVPAHSLPALFCVHPH
jgi:hypothetical protein